MRQSCFRSISAAVLLALAGASEARAQLDNPVYVDDSPQARELFLRAQDQVKDNTGEAVRLFQELLDEYGMKLLPVSEIGNDHFIAARLRVIDEIARNPELLERYQLVETAEAERLLEAGELEQLVMTRSLTEPGLEALMRVAQQALESAKFHVALHWLDEAADHPSSGERHAMYVHMMRGMAGRGIGDQSLVSQSIAELAELAGPDAEACRHQLEALAAAAVPALSAGVSPLDRPHVSDLSSLVGQPIWREQLELGMQPEPPPLPDDIDPALHELVQQREGGRYEASVSTATLGPAAVYVAGRSTVHALDRYTGQPLWSKPYELNSALGGSFSGEGSLYTSLNVAALGSQSLVVITTDPRLRAGSVVCLDPHTGLERWARPITEIGGGEDTENIMPHGAPVIAEGLVFILARKVTRQLLTSCYVLALDLETGAIEWSRHVASVGGTFNRDMRPLTMVVYDQGDLYIDSSVGAVGRIDASTGQTRWLRRFTAPITAMGKGRTPYELGGAVVTRPGVLTLQADLNRITLLDSESGVDIESHDASTASGWGSPRYLLAGGDFAYAIGRDVRAFHLDNLSEPYWRLPESSPQGRLRSGLGDRSVDIRGRVQLVHGSLIVPTIDGVLIVEDESGIIQHELAIDVKGNPVASESQLVVAGSNEVASFMPFDRAEEILRQRIASEPTDARPALALLEMSILARDFTLLLEAADLALAAIGASTDAQTAGAGQRELFAMLLEADRQRLAQSREQGESLHAIIGQVASDASQRVQHLLARGDWLSSAAINDLGRAVESYQEILATPALAVVAGDWDDQVARLSGPGELDLISEPLAAASRQRVAPMLIRSAAATATRRLAALIAKHGESVYSPQAHFAASQLQALGAGASPAELLALARKFPLAHAAVDATIAAAEQLSGVQADAPQDSPRATSNSHDAQRAFSALIEMYRARPDKARASRLLGQAVELCQRQGWHDLAAGVLRHAGRAFGAVQLETTTGPRNALAWLRSIASQTPEGGAGLVQAVAEPLTGRLVKWANASDGLAGADSGSDDREYQQWQSVSRDRLLLIEETAIRLLGAPQLNELWKLDIGEDDPRLLMMDESRLMLWLGDNVEDPHAIMLRATDGQQTWPGPSLRFGDALAQAGAAAADQQAIQLGRVDVQTPDGRLLNLNEIIPVVAPTAGQFVLVRRTGDVVALDVETGQNAQWAQTGVLDQIHLAQVTDWALLLAGTKRVWNDALGDSETVAQIVALDLRNGARLATVTTPGGEPLIWMRVTALGALLVGSPGSIELIDILGGSDDAMAAELDSEISPGRIWTNVGHYAQATRRAWLAPDNCVLEDRNRMVRSIDLATGRISEPVDVGIRGDAGDVTAAELVDVYITADAVASLYSQRVALTDHQGNLIGADVIAEEREYKALLPVNGGWVLLSRFRSAQDVQADGRNRRTQHTYRLYNLSSNGATIGDPFVLEPIAQRLQAVQVADGLVVLSFEDTTLAIKAPLEPQAPAPGQR